MESVIDKIRQTRVDESKNKALAFPTETVVDGCKVKLRFADTNDNKIMAAIKSTLISAYMESAITAPAGGEFV